MTKVGTVFNSPCCQLELDIFKMTKMIDVEKLTADEGKKRLNKLIDLDDYLDACETCGLPLLS